MKIVYVADDGTQFDDELDCRCYEFKLNHQHLKDVHAFDKDGNEFEDIFAEDTYNHSMKIVVTSKEAIKDLQALANYMGFCCYADINQVGEWEYDSDKGTFVQCVNK